MKGATISGKGFFKMKNTSIEKQIFIMLAKAAALKAKDEEKMKKQYDPRYIAAHGLNIVGKGGVK
jgi:hypothetical protein